MIYPKVEIFFLIYHLESVKSEISERSQIVEEQNKKIENCKNEIVNRNYKNVNKFEYVTDTLHYFFKITEHYIFKYFNAIIVDSVLFYKFVNEFSRLEIATTTVAEKKTKESKKVKDVEDVENVEETKETANLGEKGKKKKIDEIYHLDYNSFQLFIENLKKTDDKYIISKKERAEKKKKQKIDTFSINMKEKRNNKKKELEINKINKLDKLSKLDNVQYLSDKRKFRKKFLYEICEATDTCNNKKNRMIDITKIFQKIVDRSKIRKFICINDIEKKKTYLQFFLNLSFGIFVYTYIYKHIKENYKSIKYFLFINNLNNLQKIYFYNYPYVEKKHISNFMYHMKSVNLKIFQFIYIPYFIDIYQYVNYIYNLSVLSLFQYFTCLTNFENMEMKATGKQTNETNETNQAETATWSNDAFFSDLKPHINYSSEDKMNFSKELIFDCYLYNFVFFKYIKSIRNKMKLFITKIQKSVKQIMKIFSQIYYLNNNKKKKKRREVEKKETTEEKQTPGQTENERENEKIEVEEKEEQEKEEEEEEKEKEKDDNDQEEEEAEKKEGKVLHNSCSHSIKDTINQLYSYYINLSKRYQQCVKFNYTIIKCVNLFNILLKHFFKYFPAFLSKKNNYIIYNYWDQSLIYTSSTNSANTISYKSEKKINTFKNINQYGLDFFYFTDHIKINNEKENCEKLEKLENMENMEHSEDLEDLMDIHEHESFDFLFKPKEERHNMSKNSLTTNDNEDTIEKAKKVEKVEKVKQKDAKVENIKVENVKVENVENVANTELTDKDKSAHISGVSEDPTQRFLYFLNKNRDDRIINISESFDRNVFHSEYIKKEEIKKKENWKEKCEANKHSFFSKHPIVEILKKKKNYKAIIEIIENKYNADLPFVKNYFQELHKNDAYILSIYNNTIFDISYKGEQRPVVESEEVLRKRKLLQIKIFLDYENIYKKKTVQTQTTESLFKTNQTTQMSKDEEVSTISEQYAQTKKISNPILYLKDIYD